MAFQETFHASDSGNEKNAAFGLSFVCLPARCHDIQHDIDTRHDTSATSARLLRVCVAEPEADQNRRRLTESRRARLEKEHLSRDVATANAHACGPAPATSASPSASPPPPGFHRKANGCGMNGKGRKIPIAAAVSETIASLCPGLKPVSQTAQTKQLCIELPPTVLMTHRLQSKNICGKHTDPRRLLQNQTANERTRTF
jgi:hypothetical protein